MVFYFGSARFKGQVNSILPVLQLIKFAQKNWEGDSRASPCTHQKIYIERYTNTKSCPLEGQLL
jgi:hypothetical protein